MGVKKQSNTRRKWLVISLVALLHLVSTFGLFMWSFGSSMARFDTGMPASKTEQIVDLGLNILNFPLVYLAMLLGFPRIFINGVTGWLVFIANSLLWGMGMYTLVAIVIKKISTKSSDRQ